MRSDSELHNHNLFIFSSPTADEKYAYVYESGRLPPRRQMFYQLTDICIPSVQDRLKESEPVWSTCSKRDGWLRPGQIESIRKVIGNDITKSKLEMRKTKADSIAD